ncbi:MAG: hypothetical protein R3A78_08860 [Polyangiales bacterium]|nr:hypothetical protein [Myxococcales bacterium]
MRILAYIVGLTLVAAVSFGGAFPGLARAQGSCVRADAAKIEATQKRLGELKEMLLYARYAEARGPLEELSKDTTLPARQRVASFELLAMLQIAINDEEGARGTLKDLYSRDPDHRVEDPDASPKVLAAFRRAKQATVSHVNVQMENIVPTRELLRQQPMVKVRVIKFADAVDEIYVHYRQGESSDFVRMAIAPDEKCIAQAIIPPVNTQDEYDIEFYVEAVAPSGANIGSMGFRTTPLKVTVPAARACTDPNDAACRCEFFPRSPGCPYCFDHPDETACSDDPCVRDPNGKECRCAQNPKADECSEDDDDGGLFSQWWFWTIAGAVVIGGTVAGIALFSQSDDPLDGSLTSGTLKPR